MVRSIIIEKNSLLTFGKNSVGLLCGHRTNEKSSVIFMCPCPKRDAAKGDEVDLNDKWIVSHASNVSKMLPGGIQVLGIYVVINEKQLGKLNSSLKQVFGGLYKFSQGQNNFDIDQTKSYELSLLLVDPVSNTLTGKTVDSSNPLASNFGPSEVKLQEFLKRWTKVYSSFSFTDDLLLLGGDKSQLVQKIQASFEPIRKSIGGLTGVSNGGFLSPDSPAVQDSAPKPKGGKKKQQAATETEVELHVELLCPCPATSFNPYVNATDSGVEKLEGSGTVLLSGKIPVFALVPPKANGAQVMSALKTDLIRSLNARLTLVSEELSVTSGNVQFDEDVNDPNYEEAESAAETVTPKALLPQRVLLQNNIFLSDYAFHSESSEDILERVQYFCDLKLSAEDLDYSHETIPEGVDVVEEDFGELVEEVEEVESAVKEAVVGERKYTLLLPLIVLIVAVFLAIMFTYIPS